MKISIIIPNYNGEKILKKNLPSVLAAVKNYKKAKSFELIIADDASSDNSIEVINHFITSIKDPYIKGMLVENHDRKEGGFSKNVNRAVAKSTGDILILLNTDVSPHKDFLYSLLTHFNDEKVFAVGCMDESIEGGKKVLRGRGIGRWQRGFLMHKRGEIDRSNTLWVSGGSGAFRKKIWDMLGGMDVLYNPFYWEDIDLSYRALKAGYNVVFDKKSVVDHEHDTGSIKSHASIIRVKTIAYRNQFIFVWKNITDKTLLMSHVFWFPYHFWKALVLGEYAFFGGFFQAFIMLPKIISSRMNTQKMFIKRDSEILRQFTE